MKRAQALGVRTWIEIDRRALRSNLTEFSRRARPAGIMAVVKSNAYGHGLSLVAKLLAESEKRTVHRSLLTSHSLWFGVDSIVEALRLRRDGIKNPILVFGYTLSSRFSDAVRGRITLTISSFEGLTALRRARARPAFHLKLDTGMHRQGFQEHEIPKLAVLLSRGHLVPGGAYSHYAFPENARDSRMQRSCLERCIRELARAGIRSRIVHMSATGGVWERRDRYPMVRIGFGLFGYLRRPVAKNPLRPVLTWKTVVSEVKRVKKGERIGYDFTETFRRDSVIAILPIGYWHGFDRGLSSIGEVLIRGKRAKVMGRVSMDMTAVDVTDIRGVAIGDEVVLIGRQGREFVGADEIAEKIGTTAYEVLTRINPLIRRIIRE